MKLKIPRGYKLVGKTYATVNPAYPEAHDLRYEGRRVCDSSWGRQWTRPVYHIRMKN